MALKIISLKKQETAQPIKVETQDEIVTQPEGAHPEAALGERANKTGGTAAPVATELEKATFFQAFGMIEAEGVEVIGRKIIISVGSQEYRGWIEPRQFGVFRRYLEERGYGKIYLKVYAKTFSTPEQPLSLEGWQIVAWKKGLPPEMKANQFIIKGVWQVIPQSERPVITIYRNDNAHDPTGKYKATHLPVIMDREDYQPFPYNPFVTLKEKKYFIQGLFEFDPLSSLFIFQYDLEPPTDKIPPYRRADKIGVLRAVEEKRFKPGQEKARKAVKEQPDKAKEAQKPSSASFESQIIMLEGKVPEVTIKFSQKPEIPSEGKTVILQIKGENGISVRATLGA